MYAHKFQRRSQLQVSYKRNMLNKIQYNISSPNKNIGPFMFLLRCKMFIQVPTTSRHLFYLNHPRKWIKTSAYRQERRVALSHLYFSCTNA